MILRFITALLIMLFSGMDMAVSGGSARASMDVTMNVVPSFQYSILHQPAFLVIEEKSEDREDSDKSDDRDRERDSKNKDDDREDSHKENRRSKHADAKAGKKRVTIRHGVTISVQADDPAGYLLSIQLQDHQPFSRMRAYTDDGASIYLRPGEDGVIKVQDVEAYPDIVKISFTFYLKKNVKADKYAWPVVVAAFPL